MAETRTEWAGRVLYYDGTVKHTIGSHRESAELIVDSIATHIESLNEPARKENGVDEVHVVSRLVTVEDDGTQIIKPWRFERAGVPWRDGGDA